MLDLITSPVHKVVYGYEVDASNAGREMMTTVDNQLPGGGSVSRYRYGYDVLGRRDLRIDDGSAISTDAHSVWSYNPRSEVEAQDRYAGTDPANPGAAILAEAFDYDYDAIGNRESADLAGLAVSYTPDRLNQYDAISRGGASVAVAHDDDGNQTLNGTWSYRWNGENRLIEATDGSTMVTFTYDYQGRLVKRAEGAATAIYVYDGWNRIATFNAAGALSTTNLWGRDLSGSMQGAGGVGGLLKEGDRYPLHDANGNITQKLNSSGTTDMAVEYDPFGNIISGSLVGEYGFSTKPQDEDTGLYYYGYRWYDPVMGRWPSRDPISERGGLNLYGFVGNEPVGRWDLLGLTNDFCKTIEDLLKDPEKLRDFLDSRLVCEDQVIGKCDYSVRFIDMHDGSSFSIPAITALRDDFARLLHSGHIGQALFARHFFGDSSAKIEFQTDYRWAQADMTNDVVSLNPKQKNWAPRVMDWVDWKENIELGNGAMLESIRDPDDANGHGVTILAHELGHVYLDFEDPWNVALIDLKIASENGWYHNRIYDGYPIYPTRIETRSSGWMFNKEDDQRLFYTLRPHPMDRQKRLGATTRVYARAYWSQMRDYREKLDEFLKKWGCIE